MKHTLIHIILLIFILSGCSKKKANIITLNLEHADFVEKIDAPGTIQAVNTLTIVAPRVPVSSMTVAHLAADGSNVKRGDTVCILAAPELVSRSESYTIALETLLADLKKLEADNAMNISLLEAQIDNNNAQLEMNSLDSIQQKFAPPLNQQLFKLELEKATVEKNKLKTRKKSIRKIFFRKLSV